MVLLTAKTTTSLPSHDSPVADIEINRGSFQQTIMKFIKKHHLLSVLEVCLMVITTLDLITCY